jgi:hypothetical protein
MHHSFLHYLAMLRHQDTEGRYEILALIKGDFISEIEGTRWNPFLELMQL